MGSIDYYQNYRDALHGMAEDFTATKVRLCFEFSWTEEEFENQSIDFITKCIIYLDEVNQAKKRANKNN